MKASNLSTITLVRAARGKERKSLTTLASLLAFLLSGPITQAATDVQPSQAATCTVDIEIASANWIKDQGVVEGKLETLMQAVVNGDLVFSFGSELFKMTKGEPRVFNQRIATLTASSGASVSIQGNTKEFDGFGLGIDDFGTKTESLEVNCTGQTTLPVVIDVEGRALAEGDGRMLLLFVAQPQ